MLEAYQKHSYYITSKFLDLMKPFYFLPELADYIVPLCVIPAKRAKSHTMAVL